MASKRKTFIQMDKTLDHLLTQLDSQSEEAKQYQAYTPSTIERMINHTFSNQQLSHKTSDTKLPHMLKKKRVIFKGDMSKNINKHKQMEYKSLNPVSIFKQRQPPEPVELAPHVEQKRITMINLSTRTSILPSTTPRSIFPQYQVRVTNENSS